MRQLVYLVCCLGLAGTSATHAQVLAQTPASTSSDSPSGVDPQSPSQPAAQQPAAAPAEAATAETRSLFDPTWHQFMFGGRWSSVSGDPARFQRYQDVRDGVMFTDALFAREDPDGNWLFHAGAD